jgi:transcriptional regulator with XRE-family HTH domain
LPDTPLLWFLSGMSLQKQLDFREQLKKELITRSEKNPKYGLRAFAKTLDMDSSHLSKILKGLRPLKIEMIETLAPKLGYNKKDITKFIEFALNKNSPEIVTDNCYHLKMDQLALISEWQHYAILEIMKHPDFQQSSEWISMHLHQPTEVIEMAIERLKRVGTIGI